MTLCLESSTNENSTRAPRPALPIPRDRVVVLWLWQPSTMIGSTWVRGVSTQGPEVRLTSHTMRSDRKWDTSISFDMQFFFQGFSFMTVSWCYLAIFDIRHDFCSIMREFQGHIHGHTCRGIKKKKKIWHYHMGNNWPRRSVKFLLSI